MNPSIQLIRILVPPLLTFCFIPNFSTVAGEGTTTFGTGNDGAPPGVSLLGGIPFASRWAWALHQPWSIVQGLYDIVTNCCRVVMLLTLWRWLSLLFFSIESSCAKASYFCRICLRSLLSPIFLCDLAVNIIDKYWIFRGFFEEIYSEPPYDFTTNRVPRCAFCNTYVVG